MAPELFQESLFLPVNSTDTLHLKHFYQKLNGEVVLMLHGSVENGKIFYSQSGKGLAPYLAQHGYDVYVADLRGRGLSTPPIGRGSTYGQTEAITEDIPTFIKAIQEKRGVVPQHWVAHSWGGVLLCSFLARFPEKLTRVRSMVCFGTKRTIRVRNFKKRLVMDFFWDRLGRLVVKIFGYLPVKQMGLGSDNETDKSHLHCKRWVQPNSKWIDPEDGFDYGHAIQSISLPPTLHLAAIADPYLGNPSDVKDFIKETGVRDVEYLLLSRENGNLHDYGHVDMMTQPDAVRDHFPKVLEWLRSKAIT